MPGKRQSGTHDPGSYSPATHVFHCPHSFAVTAALSTIAAPRAATGVEGRDGLGGTDTPSHAGGQGQLGGLPIAPAPASIASCS